MLEDGTLKIRPLAQDQIGPASVDLTLSNEWYFFKGVYEGRVVDLSKTGYRSAFRMKKAKSVTLATGQMCLGKTVEKLTLPSDVMGKLEGRSRYARMGLIIHITSALVQPGSDNRQVLEIVNLAPVPVKIHAGMRISQVLFERMESGTAKPYARFGKIAKRQ